MSYVSKRFRTFRRPIGRRAVIHGDELVRVTAGERVMPYITVRAGCPTDGYKVGKAIVEVLRRYKEGGGSVE